jgi:regulator of sigma E protease
MLSISHTLVFFLLALSILVAFHEFGHFLVARKLGVRVLRFSVGFGKPLLSYQKNPESTEFVLAAIPLGGYVQMLGEKEEGSDATPDAFYTQSVWVRMAIVLAGPIFNLLLAIFIYWMIFITGETGMRPVLSQPPQDTLAAQAGFIAEDEIIAIDGRKTPTWSSTMTTLFTEMLDHEDIQVEVRQLDGSVVIRQLFIPQEVSNDPSIMHDKLGLQPWNPPIPPVMNEIQADMPADLAGLQKNDLILSADGQQIVSWQQWVDYVKERPDVEIQMIIERDGIEMPVTLVPATLETEAGTIGRIGVTVIYPESLLNDLRVEYQLGFGEAIEAAISRTLDISVVSLKMMGRILVGDAPVKNLSGPISIAQYAGKSASMGTTEFLKFLALVSISLGVLNLLPIPMLDGGHFAFYVVELIKGNPVSEQVQLLAQQVGIALLLSLMCLTFYLDIERLVN